MRISAIVTVTSPLRGPGATHDAEPGGDAGFLRLLVIDTGPGHAATSPASGEGVGLTNIEHRLRHYFGASAAMTIRPTPGGGTTVEVCVPWKANEPAVAAARG